MLGHEGAGVVRWTGSAIRDKSLKPGDVYCSHFTPAANVDSVSRVDAVHAHT